MNSLTFDQLTQEYINWKQKYSDGVDSNGNNFGQCLHIKYGKFVTEESGLDTRNVESPDVVFSMYYNKFFKL